MVLAISPRRLSKVAVAIGGFLIFVGVIMVSILALLLTGYVDVSVLEEIFESVDYRMLFLGVFLAIGVLDIVSGIILRHW